MRAALAFKRMLWREFAPDNWNQKFVKFVYTELGNKFAAQIMISAFNMESILLSY